MTSTWRHIGLHGHNVGTFTLDNTSINWRSATSNTKIEIAANKVLSANFTPFGPVGHLVVTTSNPKSEKQALRFDGFRPSDYEKLKDVFNDAYEVILTRKSYCSAGASFGVTDIQMSSSRDLNNSNIQTRQLVFLESIIENNKEALLSSNNDDNNDDNTSEEEVTETTGEEIMSLNLKDVSQCVLPGTNRNEIELQFHESDAMNGDVDMDQLVQIRFYVPPETDVSDPNDATPAEFLQKRIMEAAQIKSTTGEKIAEFPEHQGTFLTPRGRYAIELYEGYLRLRGAKYDYKIKYDDLSRLFLLPKPDEIHYAFVIALDKPIRQGQQRYQYLILQCTQEQAEVTINLDEEILKNDYNNEIQPVMAGRLSNIIAKTFKVITRKKVFIPGKFSTVGNSKCVKCALKANEGHLYPLEKQFLFIHKPAVLIRFGEIDSVEFQRYAGGAGSTRNFDLCVSLKDGSSIMDGSREYIFSGIDRSDYNALYSFLSSKHIRIKNLTSSLNAGDEDRKRKPVYDESVIFGAGGEGSEESEDEDYNANAQSESSSSDDGDDDDSDDDNGDDSDLEEIRKTAAKSKKGKEETVGKSDASNPRKKKKKVRYLFHNIFIENHSKSCTLLTHCDIFIYCVGS